MKEELLGVLLLVRTELRVALPNQVLEHGGPDAGLGALLPVRTHTVLRIRIILARIRIWMRWIQILLMSNFKIKILLEFFF